MGKSVYIKKQNLPVLIIFLVEVLYVLIAVFRPFLDFSGIVILEILLFTLQPFIFVSSLIFLFVYLKKNRILAFAPIITVILGFSIWLLVQRFDADARLYLPFYNKTAMQIVNLVKSDSLPYREDSNKKYKYMNLPENYKNTTKNGAISVSGKENNLIVFFYISRTFTGLEGFVYSENDTPPEKGIFNWKYVSSRKITKNWYWTVFY